MQPGAQDSGLEVVHLSIGSQQSRKRPNRFESVSMGLLALAALLGVQAEDTACLLQSQKAQALRTTECPNGYETYDFSTWEAKLYTTGEGPPEGGIEISSFEATEASGCLQPGILDDSDGDILDCNCKALVMAFVDNTDDTIAVCSPRRDQFPWIELSFVEPQTILEVEFFDIRRIREGISITYWVTGGDSNSISLETAGGRFAPSPLDLSGLTSPAPVDIERMRLLSSRGGSAFFSLGSV